MLEPVIAITVRFIEGVAAFMIAGSVLAGAVELGVAAFRRHLAERTTAVRLRLAERLVLSLEFLIAADILKTVVTPTLEGMGVLGAVIVIRTVLSLSIAYELRRDDQRASDPVSKRPFAPAAHGASVEPLKPAD
ncbi:MAG: DUF1622 domain-containing protein [Phycisphaerales bacterium]